MGTENNTSSRLPRSQRKKLRKEEYKQKRRQRRPEKRKQKRAIKQLERREFLASMDDEGRKTFVLNERKAKIEHQENLNSLLDHAYNEGVGVCINCSFNEIMNPREIRSLAKQLSMSYNLIKKHMAPIKMVLTSFSHDSALYKDCELFGIQNWKIHKHEQGFWEIFESEKIIVLTPDATEILEEIQHDKVYIIGGLVDTNVKKVHSNLY